MNTEGQTNRLYSTEVDQQAPKAEGRIRRRYTSPNLTEYGTITDITAGNPGSTGLLDGMSGTNMTRTH